MNIRLWLLILPALLLSPPVAQALTGEQIKQICAASASDCSEHALLQAYVGGALDVVAVLEENAGLAEKLYCLAPDELFDVSAIIRFMRQHADEYRERNAMQMLVRYLDENGGCP